MQAFKGFMGEMSKDISDLAPYLSGAMYFFKEILTHILHNVKKVMAMNKLIHRVVAEMKNDDFLASRQVILADMGSWWSLRVCYTLYFAIFVSTKTQFIKNEVALHQHYFYPHFGVSQKLF